MDGREGFQALTHVMEGWAVGQAVPTTVIISWANGGPAQCGRDVKIQSAGRLPAAPCMPVGHKAIELGVITNQCARGVCAQGALVDRVSANELLRIKQHTQGGVHGVGQKEQPRQEVCTLSTVWGRAYAAVAIGQPKQNSACFKDGPLIRFQCWDQTIGLQGHVGIQNVGPLGDGPLVHTYRARQLVPGQGGSQGMRYQGRSAGHSSCLNE